MRFAMLICAILFSVPALAGKTNTETDEQCWGVDCIDSDQSIPDRAERPDGTDQETGPAAGTTTTDSTTAAGACEAVADRVYDLCLASPSSDASACARERDIAFDNCIGISNGEDSVHDTDPTGSDQGSDERVVVQNPARVPFQGVTKVRIGPKGKGRGSAMLVGPCTLLTNSHVVYNRKDGGFRVIKEVHPGSYYDETINKQVDPYGSQPDYQLATNNKWVETGESKYDYGAIFVASPFPGITSYMPVIFKAKPGYINMAGYPSEDLPSTARGATQEQWRGFGDVVKTERRLLYYDATSTGGASGGPVWSYDSATGEREMVAINRSHSEQYDGIGVRLVGKNESVIVPWIVTACPNPTARSVARISFPTLLSERRTLSGKRIEVRSPEDFGLVPAPQSMDDLVLLRKVVQWIEGEAYHWEELAPQATLERRHRDRGPGLAPLRLKPQSRVIRLLQPERRVLTPEEGAVLLSASRLWQRQAAKQVQPVIYDPTPVVFAVNPDDAPRRADDTTVLEVEVLDRPRG